MLYPSERFLNAPVMSLQTGSELGRTRKAIIDPHSLTILAYEVTGPLFTASVYLRIEDIREISHVGMIIDSQDELVTSDDIVKLQQTIELNFHLLGYKVIDTKDNRIGKVIGYTVDPNEFSVEQLQVKRPLFKSFNDSELLLRRNSIYEVTNSAIIIHSETQTTKPKLNQQIAKYSNPFSKESPRQVEQSDIHWN